MMASVRTWAGGERGRVVWSLAQGLLLPKDKHFLLGGDDESLANQL